LLQLLDELKNQAALLNNGRQKTTHWPDWKRLPASEQMRDQLPGMWHSFTLVGFALFVGLLGCEWFLRRRWELA
jgi:type VI protein secretion system component VasF